MRLFSRAVLRTSLLFCFIPAGLVGCKSGGNDPTGAGGQPPFMSAVASAPPQTADDPPPPEKIGGFDGKRAFALVARQVSFGPRPSGSPAIVQLQDFLQSELKNYGCAVETDNFSADTPAGRL